MGAMIAGGEPGPTMVNFLTEIVGLTAARIDELRNAPRGYDVRPIVSATMPREAEALASVDLPALAAKVPVPVLLILGTQSPAWAHSITKDLAAALPQSTLAVMDGQGHEATETAPELLASRLAGFFGY